MKDGIPRRPSSSLARRSRAAAVGQGGSQTRQGFVCASVIHSHDCLARGPNGCAEVIHHGGHKGTRQDATRNKSRESHSDSGTQSQPPNCNTCGRLPPGVIREIARQRGGDRGTKLPIERGEEIMIQNVPIDAHVIQKLGNVSALPR